eukprot:TRINITY_DN6841_c0_g1_i1.p1 TRINITY_DN6841_c0_g1~~TRINITY_DN6841_c0_g1_i1.p1  ORF type:complete len:561 (-),score=58.62 TRINITY_DN6841_c0_g1_i1:8-1690(-)
MTYIRIRIRQNGPNNPTLGDLSNTLRDTDYRIQECQDHFRVLLDDDDDPQAELDRLRDILKEAEDHFDDLHGKKIHATRSYFEYLIIATNPTVPTAPTLQQPVQALLTNVLVNDLPPPTQGTASTIGLIPVNVNVTELEFDRLNLGERPTTPKPRFIVEVPLALSTAQQRATAEDFARRLVALSTLDQVASTIFAVLLLPNITANLTHDQLLLVGQTLKSVNNTLATRAPRLKVYEVGVSVAIQHITITPFNNTGDLRNLLMSHAHRLVEGQRQDGQEGVQFYHYFTDPDTRFKIDGGQETSFEFYNRKGQKHNWPKLMSGGFRFDLGQDRQEEARKLNIAYDLAQRINKRLNQLLPGAGYFSEANTVMRIDLPASPHFKFKASLRTEILPLVQLCAATGHSIKLFGSGRVTTGLLEPYQPLPALNATNYEAFLVWFRQIDPRSHRHLSIYTSRLNTHSLWNPFKVRFPGLLLIGERRPNDWFNSDLGVSGFLATNHPVLGQNHNETGFLAQLTSILGRNQAQEARELLTRIREAVRQEFWHQWVKYYITTQANRQALDF